MEHPPQEPELPPYPFPSEPLREPHPQPIIELLPAPGGTFEARPASRDRASRPRWSRALLLLALTFLTTTTVSPVFWMLSRTDVTTDLSNPMLTREVVERVWGDPELLRIGLTFSLSALAILLAHELGHYAACRWYRVPCTLPYFLPVPLNLGTFGAFIRIRAPLRNRRELFDVGIAGPIAGFVALLPFLFYGIEHSGAAPPPAAPPGGFYQVLSLGRCLAIDLVFRLYHGPVPEGAILNLHPMAMAAWLGLLATAINLLPLGQLDGGHVLYATYGRRQRRLALPLWLALAVCGFWWPGWWVWCVVVLLLGLFHPPIRDESVALGTGRRRLAWLAWLMLLLSFIPVPIEPLIVGGGEADAEPAFVRSAPDLVAGQVSSSTSR